jgi:hypothetical protein
VVTCAYPADQVTPSRWQSSRRTCMTGTYYRATGDGSPVKISDFLSRERFHCLGLYVEFFRHLPVEHQVAVSLPSPDIRVVGIALNRSSAISSRPTATLSVSSAPLTTALARAEGRHRAWRTLTFQLAASGPT